MNKKELLTKHDGDIVSLVGYIKSYDIANGKNGNKYINGVLEMQGSVGFKVWSGALFDEMSTKDYQGTICSITAKVNVFGGVTGIILNSCMAVEEGVYKEEDFFEVKYDVKTYMNGLYKILTKYCNEGLVKVYDSIIEQYGERFKVEFAAHSHHDAVKSGLLAHTYKVTYAVSKMMLLYPNIKKKCTYELLIFGSALHDIGKVHEYYNGAMSDVGMLVSHPQLGIEIILPFKEDIIRASSEEFFYRLMGIISSHHGEWGEPARNIEAMIIHYADNMESKLEIIDESIGTAPDSTIYLGDYKLK